MSTQNVLLCIFTFGLGFWFKTRVNKMDQDTQHLFALCLLYAAAAWVTDVLG